MKLKYKFIFGSCNGLMLIVFLFSCKKDTYKSPSIASVIVANSIVSGPSIRLKDNSTTISNNSSAKLTFMAGEFELYAYPVGDSLNPYYTDPKFIAEDRGIYSLFLAGQFPNISTLLLKDNIPYYSDSTFGVRFINLSPNSTPLNITLSTNPLSNEVSNFSYLQYTDFIPYSAKAANSTYTFQFRRASDNVIVMSYSLNPIPRFANITVIIRGLVGNLGITRITNDR